MSDALELKRLMLAAPKLSLAVAESLTAGHLQSLVTSASGSSGYFRGGITAYALDQKARHLGVNAAHARRVNGVSQRVAVEMASGALDLFGADVAVATTGYAEPSPADRVREPCAWWAICHRLKGRSATVVSGFVEVPGRDRIEAQAGIARVVLAELVAYLAGWRAERKAARRR